MLPMRTALTSVLVATSFASAAATGTIIVDPGGGGDYDNIPEAAANAHAGDTVLVMPGTYAVQSGALYGWPVTLDSDSPVFLGHSGAAATVLQGDGSLPAFEVPDGTPDARISIHGFFFHTVLTPVYRDWTTEGIIDFTDNITENCSNGLTAYHGLTGTIARNLFNGFGPEGVLIDGFQGVVEDNEVTDFGTGISGAGAGAVISGNHVHHCLDTGISGYGDCVARGNVVEDNQWMGFSISGDAHLEGNVIRRNEVGVQFWDGPHYGHVHENDIVENTLAMSTHHHSPVPDPLDFDATSNWWGTTDPLAISELLHDCHDDMLTALCFVFDPWCAEPGCGPVPVEPSSWGTIKALYR